MKKPNLEIVRLEGKILELEHKIESQKRNTGDEQRCAQEMLNRTRELLEFICVQFCLKPICYPVPGSNDYVIIGLEPAEKGIDNFQAYPAIVTRRIVKNIYKRLTPEKKD